MHNEDVNAAFFCSQKINTGRGSPLGVQATCLLWNTLWMTKEQIWWHHHKHHETKNCKRKGFIFSLPNVSSSIKQRKKSLDNCIQLRIEEGLKIHLKIKVTKSDLNEGSANEISSTYTLVNVFCLLQLFYLIFQTTKGNSKTRKETRHSFSRKLETNLAKWVKGNAEKYKSVLQFNLSQKVLALYTVFVHLTESSNLV